MTATHPMAPISITKQEGRQNIDKGLAAILELLKAGTATRLPIVQSLFHSAVKIFEISQKDRDNQDEFVEIAEEGCRLVYSISFKLADKQEIEPDLKANLQDLRDVLQSIEIFGERGTDEFGDIKAQKRRSERCMRLFGFQSLHDLRDETNQLVEQRGKSDGVPNTTTKKYVTGTHKTNYYTNNVNTIGVYNNISSTFDRIMFRHNASNDTAGEGSAISRAMDRIWGK